MDKSITQGSLQEQGNELSEVKFLDLFKIKS